MQVEGGTLREAFDHAFAQLERARSYLLDDQGGVRHHVAVFVDGVLVHDRRHLQVPLAADSEIWVMQALSGG
jgi:sulfur carrier protein ThiS